MCFFPSCDRLHTLSHVHVHLKFRLSGTVCMPTSRSGLSTCLLFVCLVCLFAVWFVGCLVCLFVSLFWCCLLWPTQCLCNLISAALFSCFIFKSWKWSYCWFSSHGLCWLWLKVFWIHATYILGESGIFTGSTLSTAATVEIETLNKGRRNVRTFIQRIFMLKGRCGNEEDVMGLRWNAGWDAWSSTVYHSHDAAL